MVTAKKPWAQQDVYKSSAFVTDKEFVVMAPTVSAQYPDNQHCVFVSRAACFYDEHKNCQNDPNASNRYTDIWCPGNDPLELK